jgi:hypothetical protein
MQPTVVFISFQDMKMNRTFATPLHTLNIDSSSFGESAHATNFAQVEHRKLKSPTKTWAKHTKKKSAYNFHTWVKKLRGTQNKTQDTNIEYKIKLVSL